MIFNCPSILQDAKLWDLLIKLLLGLCGMFLKRPDISILDMNYYLQMLIVHMDIWSLNASEVLHDEDVLYSDFHLRRMQFGTVQLLLRI